MPIAREPFRDVNEDEYIFDCLNNFPEKYKGKLTQRELEIIKSPSSIRKFITRSTPGRVMLLLAKRNIGVVKLYCDFEKEKPVDLKNFNKLYKQFGEARHRQEIINNIISGNLFAQTTREVLNACYLIAQNCHSPYYFLNRDYNRVYDAVTDIGIQNLNDFDGSTEATKIKETDKSRKIVAALAHAFMSAENTIRVQFKTDMLGIQILLFLFMYRDTFVDKKSLIKNIWKYTEKSISVRCYDLQRDGFIEMNRANHKNMKFTIAEHGIYCVNELLQLISHQAINI